MSVVEHLLIFFSPLRECGYFGRPEHRGHADSEQTVTSSLNNVVNEHILCYRIGMPENLHNLLEADDPVALGRIETALDTSDTRNEAVETVISALIWRRCTASPTGVLGAVLHHECASRISVLPHHLDRVGASDAAQAVRDLRDEIPLEDEQIRNGIIDWVDANPDLTRHAATLDKRVSDIAPKLWSFMQQRQDELPDTEIPDKNAGLLASLVGGFLSMARQRPSAER